MSISKTVADIISNMRGVSNIEKLTRAGRGVEEITETVKDADTGVVGRAIRRATGHQEDLRAAAISETRRQTALEQKLKKQARDLSKTLSKTEKEMFEVLYERGQKLNNGQGGWITDEQIAEVGDLIGKDLTNLTNVYKQFKADSDLDYYALNALERRELDRLGFKRDGLRNVKEVNSSIVDTEGYSRMVINDGTKNITSVTMSADEIKAKYFDKGYKLYEVHAGSANELGLDFTHYLAKDVTLKELPTNILPYAAGGRRAYTKGKAFVKIGSSFFQDGKYLNGWAKTLVAGNNIADLQQYADEVNQALQFYKSAGNNSAKLDAMIKNAGFEKFRINSAKDLKELIKTADNPQGILDVNHKAKVLNSGEQYIYDNNWQNAFTSSDDVVDTAMQDLLNLRSRYFRGRTHLLDDINGEKTSLISVQDVWENTIKRASYNATLGPVYQDWARYFKANFRKVIRLPNDAAIDSVSELNLIRTAQVIDETELPDLYKPVARAAKRTQQTFMRLINTPTKTDKAITGLINKSLQGVIPRRWWDNRYVAKLMNANPVKGAQALVFRAAMGFFNTAQLWKQALGITTSISLEPVQGMRALAALPAVSVAYLTRNTPKLYNAVRHFGFMKADELDGLIKFMEDHGTMSMLGSHATLSDKIDAGSLDLFFANLGNTLNYIVADTAAYFAKGGKTADTRVVAEYADKLALSMTRASNSALQHSFLGRLLSQWLTYPMACVETMFNKKLSKAQRVSFLTAQLGMWGVGGTFAGNHAVNLYNYLTEDEGIDNDIANYITDGIITTLAAEAGFDIREGVDAWGLFQNLFGMFNVFSEDFGQIPKIKAARALTIIGDTFNTIKELIYPETGVFDQYNFYRMVAEKSGNFTSLRNASKALLSLQARKFYDRYGDVVKDNVTAREALMQAIGVGPVEERLRQDAYTLYNQEKEAVTEMFEEFVKPYINEINTFNKTSQVPGRNREWIQLEARLQKAWKSLLEHVRRECPEHENTLVNMYTKEYYTGFDESAKDKNKLLKLIFESNAINRFNRSVQ